LSLKMLKLLLTKKVKITKYFKKLKFLKLMEICGKKSVKINTK